MPLTILEWLADTNPLKALKIPKFDDPELPTRLRELDEKADKSRIRMCIAQEYVNPAPLKVSDVTFRPTVRIVVVACFDTENRMLTVKVPEAFYKLPTTPVLHSNKLLWDETISYHETNRQVDLQNKDFLWQMTEKAHLAKQESKTKYPYVILIPEALQEIIKEDIVQSLTPVCAYLFLTNAVNYYDEILGSKNSLDALMRQALKLCDHRDLDEKVCDVYANKRLNVAVILLYHLHSIINIYKHIGHLSLFPADLAKMLLKYQVCFGDRNEEEMGSIHLLAKYLLGEEAILTKIFSKQDLKSVKSLLTYYHEEKFDLLIAEDNYSKGINEFKAGNYSEATKLLTLASKNYLEGSKEQAICFYSLASCYIKQDQYEQAVKMAKMAVDLRTVLFDSQLITEVDLKRAQTKLEDATNLAKAEKIAQSALAVFKNSKYGEAKDGFKQAISIHDKVQKKSARLATYHYNLASAYDRMGMSEQAVKHCDICCKMRTELLGSQSEPAKAAQDKLAKLQEKISSKNLKLCPES